MDLRKIILGLSCKPKKTTRLYSRKNIVKIPSDILDSGRRSCGALNYYKFSVFAIVCLLYFLHFILLLKLTQSQQTIDIKNCKH